MKQTEVDYSKLSVRERICLAEQIYISYPRLSELQSKISYCHQHSKYSAEPECLFINGPTGTGKSTLYRRYEQQFTRQETDNGTVVPVLSATIPVPATVKSLATRLLFNLGDPAAEMGTTYNKTLRLERLMKNCSVELIILDEFQHFIDRDSHKILQTISDWLKNLLNDTAIPIILIGLPGSDAVLDSNQQLNRRFSVRESLDPFGWRVTKQQEEFRKFLYLLETKLPLKEPSNLADISMAFRFYLASSGVIAHVMKIVRKATVKALEQSTEHLTLDILAQAYKEVMGAVIVRGENPFQTDIEKLEFNGLEEKFVSTKATNRRMLAKEPTVRASKILHK
jgi:Cdc6-like AAA superfamily ATPase